LQAIIVAHNIQIKADTKNKKEEDTSYKKMNAKDLEEELAKNKKLINMTMGEDGNSSGSESEPSADNLDEEEMA